MYTYMYMYTYILYIYILYLIYIYTDMLTSLNSSDFHTSSKAKKRTGSPPCRGIYDLTGSNALLPVEPKKARQVATREMWPGFLRTGLWMFMEDIT